MAKKNILMMVALWAALIGGVVHVVNPLGFNLLGLFGNFGTIVQVVAGASTVWILGTKLLKKR